MFTKKREGEIEKWNIRKKKERKSEPDDVKNDKDEMWYLSINWSKCKFSAKKGTIHGQFDTRLNYINYMKSPLKNDINFNANYKM